MKYSSSCRNPYLSLSASSSDTNTAAISQASPGTPHRPVRTRQDQLAGTSEAGPISAAVLISAAGLISGPGLAAGASAGGSTAADPLGSFMMPPAVQALRVSLAGSPKKLISE